jgi:hypothetical protein
MRTSLAILALVIVPPLTAQPVPKGDEIRLREGSGAPWTMGVYAGRDAASIVLMQAGIERTYELLATERIEWKGPTKFLPRFLLTTGLGAVMGLGVEFFRQVFCLEPVRYGFDSECNEHWGRAAAIGGVVGGGLYTLGYTIRGQRKWRDVTDRFPPAGGAH